MASEVWLNPNDMEPELPEIVFCSSNRAQAQRVIARLRRLARVRWESASVAINLAVEGHAHVVLIDFDEESSAGASNLAHEIHHMAPMAALVAVGSTSGPRRTTSVLAALRAGVRDFLDLDESIDETNAIIAKALDHAVMMSNEPTDGQQTRKGKVVAVLGVRAGVGTSTLVAHLAVATQDEGVEHKRASTTPKTDRTVLLDLGQPAGDAKIYLNTTSDFHVSDAIQNAYRFDATMARSALKRHTSGAAFISQPQGAAEVPLSESEDLGVLTQHLRQLFGVVLIDLGGVRHELLPRPLLATADEVWLVADQSVSTIVSLDAALKTLAAMNIPREALRLIVNRVDAEAGISPMQIAERFHLTLLAQLPERGRQLRNSANLGRLLQQDAPSDRYVRAVQSLASRLIETPKTAPVERHRGALPRLLGRVGGH